MTSVLEELRSYDVATLTELQQNAWTQATTHIDGLAIGTSIAALRQSGNLDRIASGPVVPARELEGRPGYLHVMLKLLAAQGWLERSGIPGPAMSLRYTSEGKHFHALAHHYDECSAAMTAMRRCIARGTIDDELTARLPRPDSFPSDPAAGRVCAHLDGYLAAALLTVLAAAGQLPTRGCLDRDLDLRAVADSAQTAAALRHFMRRLEWIEAAADSWSARGTIAALMFPQYWYPITYLPTLAAVGDLLDGKSIAGPHGSDEEHHLDRRLDIRVSGEVFGGSCRSEFLAAVLPLFDHSAPAHPRYIVDIGCGDGRLLAETWSAVAARTGPDQAPVAVGIDLNRIARETCTETLQAHSIPSLVLPGDVGQPTRLRAALGEAGIDCDDCLFVCKSVIHDRDYRPPPASSAVPDETSDLVFVADDGDLIGTSQIEQSLVTLFIDWRPLIRRFGWIAIEAHTVSANVAAAFRGRTQVSVLDATHGFSRQYLLDPPRFRRAAAAAGLRSTRHIDLGVEQLGHTVLTIDAFVTE
jgi:SAM-dependent methyltransferase